MAPVSANQCRPNLSGTVKNLEVFGTYVKREYSAAAGRTASIIVLCGLGLSHPESVLSTRHSPRQLVTLSRTLSSRGSSPPFY